MEYQVSKCPLSVRYARGKPWLDAPSTCAPYLPAETNRADDNLDLQVVHLVAGEMVWTEGEPVERVVLVAKGKLAFIGTGMGCAKLSHGYTTS